MKSTILLSGDRATYTVVVFDAEKRELNAIASYPAPYNVSWTERESTQEHADRFVGLSEGEEAGLLYTFEIDHVNNTCHITSQQESLGAPAHFVTLRDGSALALATYLGGSVALYPVTNTKNTGMLIDTASRTELHPPFPYTAAGHGPVKARQQQCHIHQVLEDKKGLLYAPDLGSDRVWILGRDKTQLEVRGWLQCPAGTGARHAVLTPDEHLMYVIGELSHTIVAFDLSTGPAANIQPIPGFAPNIIPPNVHPDHQSLMDSSELSLHPYIPNVLYASNRWERHIANREPHLRNVLTELPPGDAITIILLSDNGRRVEEVKHIRTNLDTIRGMRIHQDGEFAIAAGQEGGGVEVYRISGKRGDIWTLVAGLREGLDIGIKHAIWL